MIMLLNHLNRWGRFGTEQVNVNMHKSGQTATPEKTKLSSNFLELLEINTYEFQNLHIRIKTDPETKAISCGDCGKTFVDKNALILHAKTHEKQYLCEKCGALFLCQDTLFNHFLIHNVRKPNHCKFCGVSFMYKSALSRHVEVHTGVKPHKCSECGARFSRKNRLKTHMQLHTGEKPYKCESCGKRFAKNCAFQRHIRVHQNDKRCVYELYPKMCVKKV